MKTYEMVALADKDGLTYRLKDMFYNSKKGFFDSKGNMWRANAYVGHKEELHTFVHEDGWESVNVRTISNDIFAYVHKDRIVLSSSVTNSMFCLTMTDISKLYTLMRDLPFV